MSNYTVMITASHIKSHPSIDFIKKTMESLNYIGIKSDTPIILAHDGSDAVKYNKYFENLKEYVKDKPNVEIIRKETNGKLTASVRNAFKSVKTPYILVIQHDLPFVREFSIDKVIEDMKNNPGIKYVRFNKRKTTKRDFDNGWGFGKQLEGGNYTYTRTPGWSDNNHVTSSDYYRNIVLKEARDGGFMEEDLNGKVVDQKSHDKYGTYIFDVVNAEKVIDHTDGRFKNKLEFYRPFSYKTLEQFKHIDKKRSYDSIGIL